MPSFTTDGFQQYIKEFVKYPSLRFPERTESVIRGNLPMGRTAYVHRFETRSNVRLLPAQSVTAIEDMQNEC